MHDSGSPGKLVTNKVTDFAGADKSKTSPGKYKSKLRPFLIVAALVVTIDQLSKLWIKVNLLPTDRIELFPGFIHLDYVRNYGGVFGLLAGYTELLIALNIAGAVIILVFLYYHLPTVTLGILALALILGGGAGNLIDRIRLGYVIDFISFQLFRWPTFNIADAAIVVGIFALIYYICKWEILRKAL